MIYWDLIGFPLLWILYVFLAHVPVATVGFISLKNPVNQISNALIASLIISHTPITQWVNCSKAVKTVAFEETLLNLLVTFVLVPSLLLTIWNYQGATQQEELNVLDRLNLMERTISSELQTINLSSQSSIDRAELEQSLLQKYPPEVGLITLVDNQGQVFVSTRPELEPQEPFEHGNDGISGEVQVINEHDLACSEERKKPSALWC